MAEPLSEIRVSTWLELQEHLFEDSWQEPIRRHRSQWLFRGVHDAAGALITSLQSGNYEAHERHLLTSFRKYALRNVVHGDLEWNWLSLAKHHGLPTRLLDWSYSPYVALHFATHDLRHFDKDGAIWCADYRKTNEALPKAFRKKLSDSAMNIFSTEMIASVAHTLEQFDHLASEEFVLFFEPPSLDERIVNQFALFSLPSSPTLSLDSLLIRLGALRKVVIPASLKWEIRDKLDQANITERVLFPGLDGLSQWLKRYFATRKE